MINLASTLDLKFALNLEYLSYSAMKAEKPRALLSDLIYHGSNLHVKLGDTRA